MSKEKNKGKRPLYGGFRDLEIERLENGGLPDGNGICCGGINN